MTNPSNVRKKQYLLNFVLEYISSSTSLFML